MNKLQKIKMPVDIAMTLLSIVLMGGNYLFPADIVHEILGVSLFVLWGIHIALNRRWYASLAPSKLITSSNANDRRSYSASFKGKYNPYRAMQTVINCGILICAIFLMISGIILSNHIFTFLNIQGGLGFARIAHLLASHWYYLFMSFHIGMHVGMIANKICHSRAPEDRHSRDSEDCHSHAIEDCHSREPTRESSNARIIGPSPIMIKKAKATMPLVGKILLALACAYGIYAFITRGVWKYLILRQQFFFFDLEKGYILFAIDYISIIILFATLSHLLAKRLKKNKL